MVFATLEVSLQVSLSELSLLEADEISMTYSWGQQCNLWCRRLCPLQVCWCERLYDNMSWGADRNM